MNRQAGFTLIELLAALLILSLLALMSFRGLGTVLDAREHVGTEADKWRSLASFFIRFEHDVQLAAPRGARNSAGVAPAWLGRSENPSSPRLEFSRFASVDGVDAARRIAYHLNQRQEIELWVWPGLDIAPGAVPLRHAVLGGVVRMDIAYLSNDLNWLETWASSDSSNALPRAVRLRIVLSTGEDIVRIFALAT